MSGIALAFVGYFDWHQFAGLVCVLCDTNLALLCPTYFVLDDDNVMLLIHLPLVAVS